MNLFIFHRDLRLIDNTSLIWQLKTLKTKVVPAFIFTPEQVNPKQNKYFSSNSVQFMVESLKDLNKQVQSFQGKMHYFYGHNIDVLNQIHSKIKINSIGFNLDYTPYAKQRDQQIISWAKERNIQVFCKEDYALYELMKIDFMGKNHTAPSFTPFKQYCYSNLHVPEPDKFNKFSFQTFKELSDLSVNHDFDSQSSNLYHQNEQIAVHGGRAQALKILNGLKNFGNYFEDRNYPALPATKFSAYLHFTNVSIRQVYHKVVELFGKNHHLIFQLHCRQFFTYITHKFPNVLKQDLTKNLNPQFDTLKWNNNNNWLQRWKTGTTGIPFIDAGMREMNVTGYMHNRTRQNVACFLVKDLFIDWKEGEKYFAQKLVDYSATQNSGNWQYVAGVGTDPREVRIFNPWLQAKKYDPKCIYIKKWVPELSKVPAEDILNWQQTCKYYIQEGIKYNEPMVNHDAQVKEAQKLYKSVVMNLQNGKKQEQKKFGQNEKPLGKIEFKEKPKNENRGKKIYYKQKHPEN